MLTYSQVTRPRSALGFWRRRYIQLGVPYLLWTAVYWLYTLVTTQGSWSRAGSILANDLGFGYYQLYFVIVLFQLYLVFPLLLGLLRASRHHARVMAMSALFALVLAADLHYPHAFGPVGRATFGLAAHWPWSRNLLTYQEQFIAGVLVALHLDQVRTFIERWWRQVIGAAAAIGAIAALWYLVAVWTGSDTGRASDLYQPIAFVWFTAAVAALECGTWWWYQRTRAGHAPRFPALSAKELAGLTGGIFFGHVLVLNLLRSALGATGLRDHMGWVEIVAVLFVGSLLITGAATALILRTRLRWVLGGPVRSEQRARLGTDDVDPAVSDDADRRSGQAGRQRRNRGQAGEAGGAPALPRPAAYRLRRVGGRPRARRPDSGGPRPARGGRCRRTAGGCLTSTRWRPMWPTASGTSATPFHLVGHAYGNRVARCLAADRPDRVASLILLGCGGKVPGDDEARAALIECFTEPEGSAGTGSRGHSLLRTRQRGAAVLGDRVVARGRHGPGPGHRGHAPGRVVGAPRAAPRAGRGREGGQDLASGQRRRPGGVGGWPGPSGGGGRGGACPPPRTTRGGG